MLSLQCFDTPSISTTADLSGGSAWLPLGKPLALLTYLACAPARSATREQLIDLLWADTERDAARHTLRQTLWYIRRRLGTDPLTTRGDSIVLTAECVSDRDTFLTALDAGDHLTAVETYTGDFFPGFAAPGGAEFEQWADIERTRLRALYVRAAESLVRQRIDAWRARDAVQIARRARELAPNAQATWRLLLESLLAAEDRITALVEADQLDQWLARDEIPIEPATVSLLRQVRREPNQSTSNAAATEPKAPTSPDILAGELVGREREFSVLLTAWADARRGRGSHVHITARAGLGKTRLLDGLARRLRSTRARVVSVRAPQANRDIPFALAADLTLALARLRGAAGVSPDAASALVALAPGVSTFLSAPADRATGDDALRRRTFALQELVTTIADDAPIALLLDDLHWADQSSRTLLASLSASLRASNVLLVTASRHTDLRAGTTDSAQQLVLSPLSEDEVDALVRSMGELPDGEHEHEGWEDVLINRLHESTGGSPLLLIETLQLALERGALSLVQRRWSCTDLTALRSTLATGSAIRDRLATVSDAHQATLLLLAVLGTELDTEAVERAVGADGATALQELELRGLVSHIEARWAIAHDEIAELVRELATAARLARAHRQAAMILESETSGALNSIVRAARHRAAAGDKRETQQLFVQLVRKTESMGNTAALRALAADVRGVTHNGPTDDELLHSLPWSLRANIPRVFAAITLSLVGVLALGIVLPARSETTIEPEATAWVGYVDGSDTALYSVPIDANAWRRDGQVVAQKAALPKHTVRALASLNAVFAKWGDTVVGGRLGFGEQAGIELVQINLKSGASVRLTNARGDDYSFARSPDSRYAVFTSARADTITQRANLMLLNRNTSEQRIILPSTNWQEQPVWSPDGSRIAFITRYAEARRSALCWVSFDATESECSVPDKEIDMLRLLAWSSDYRVLMQVEARDSTNRYLAYLDVRTGEVQTISTLPAELSPSFNGFVVSRDGRFLLDLEASLGAANLRIVDLERTGSLSSATARFPLGASPFVIPSLAAWEEPSGSATALHTVRIVSTPKSIAPGSRVLLRVEGRTENGSLRSVPHLSWHVLDSSVARVSSDGELTILRSGTLRVVASAGGWRADTSILEIQEREAAVTLFRETWPTLDSSRWIAFGSPAVKTVRVREQSALHIDGDDHLNSGVILRKAVDAHRGFGVELQMQLPLSEVQWQQLSVSITGAGPDSAFENWKDRDAPEFGLTWRQSLVDQSCALVVPRGEGGDAVDQIDFTVRGKRGSIKRAGTVLTDGKWHNVRLQVFADGRCGLALDGRAIAVGRYTLAVDLPLRVILSGQSVGTRVLVGPVEMWAGERYDVDWFGDKSVPASR
jgi:DNA-binding SARP family transcriptional activator/dipeptidyl aminopeptidase/acylaminoacyl peptidase